MPPPVALVGGTAIGDPEAAILGRLKPGTVLMMGDNPALPKMPARPRLLDFFKYRFTDITFRHLLTSGKKALEAGLDEKVVMACLLHDMANGCLLRSDHGYWGAQMIAPYVTEEIAWSVQYHQALRYFADESVGYSYPGIVPALLRTGLSASGIHPAGRRPCAQSPLVHELAAHHAFRYLFFREVGPD